MAFDSHANFASGTVLTAPSPATSGTTLVLTADFNPAPTPPYNIVICPAATAPTSANAEIARVTADTTGTLTITRTQESSSARTVLVGDQVFAAMTAKSFTDIESATSGASLLASMEALFTAAGQILQGTGSGTGGLVLPPGYLFGRDSAGASNVSVASTSATAPTAVITCAAHTFDGAPVEVRFGCSGIVPPNVTSSSAVQIGLWELGVSSTAIAMGIYGSPENTIQGAFPGAMFALPITPTAGAHTYTIGAFAGSTSGTPTIAVPAYVTFRKD